MRSAALLPALALGATLLALTAGVLSPAECGEGLLAGPQGESPAAAIIWQVRLPRVLTALLVGAGLAVGGVVFQALLRNPLAEPYTLGVSGGAVLGAALAVIAGSGAIGVPGAAFIGALLAAFWVERLASRRGFSVAMLILAGVMLNFLLSAVVLFIFALATAQELHGVFLWLMGDLSAVTRDLLLTGSMLVAAGLLLMRRRAAELDLLTLGDEKARLLGVDAARVRRELFLAASLVTGACVGVAGMIGFVGLLIPHLLRRWCGPGHRVLLPAAALAGGTFLVLADTLARTLVAPTELPVGVLTGLVGGTFFIIYLLRVREWKLF